MLQYFYWEIYTKCCRVLRNIRNVGYQGDQPSVGNWNSAEKWCFECGGDSCCCNY